MSDKRFTASLNCRHRVTLTNVMGRAPVGGGTVTLTAQEDKDLRDMAGAVNQAAAAPGGCDSAALPVNQQPEIVYGDFGRKVFNVSQKYVVAFPFRVPTGPFPGPNGPLMYMSSSDQGTPRMCLMVVSATPGDVSYTPGSPLASQGKQVTIYANVGVDLSPGALLYANIVAVENANPEETSCGFSISWPKT